MRRSATQKSCGDLTPERRTESVDWFGTQLRGSRIDTARWESPVGNGVELVFQERYCLK